MFKIEHINVKGCAREAECFVKSKIKFTCIGKGSYGRVYATQKSTVVYKVGNYLDNDGYLAYIEILEKQKKHNVYTPVIHSVHVYHTTTNRDSYTATDYFVVVMERLKPIRDKDYDAWRWLRAWSQADSKIPKYTSLGIEIIIPKDLIKIMKSLQKALNTIDGICLDVHDENVMMRGEQMVIIDPLA